jgi:Ras-related protein Rab-6A
MCHKNSFSLCRFFSSKAMVRRQDDIRSIKSHKVIFIGDPSVGKTSIITRFLYGAFDTHYQATVGIDFVSKVVPVGADRSVKLQLWDTAGQERFQSLIPSYLRDTAACVVVYDVTSRKSFDSVKKWVEVVRKERGEESGVVMFLVANKKDLNDMREVTTEEGQSLADKMPMTFCELSAKTGSGVSELFQSIAQKMPSEAPAHNPNDGNVEISLDAGNAATQHKNGCAC